MAADGRCRAAVRSALRSSRAALSFAATPQRMRRASALGWLLLALWQSFPALARADALPSSPSGSPATSPDAAKAAREKFERGVELVNRDNDPEAALTAFLESFELYPTSVAALNAAVCLKELGRYANALDSYDELLRRFGSKLSPEQRASIAEQRQLLLERVGELDVKVNVPGTSIVVDGAQRGQSPLKTPLRLDVGTHMLRLSREEFQVVERSVSIAPGRRKQVAVQLAPLAGVGALSVTADDGSVLDVSIDGAIVGQTPWQGSVAVGLHSVRLVSGAGRGTAPTSVQVRLKQRSSLQLHPVQLASEALIEPEPPDAAVYIDGVFVGNGAWTGALPAAQHRFEAIAPGYAPFRVELKLAPGKRQRISARLALESRPRGMPAPLGLFLQPRVGLLLARSLRGSADQSCDCGARSRPLGYLADFRVGYFLHRNLSVDVSAGYLHVTETSTRALAFASPPNATGLGTDDLRERVALAGPFAGLGVSLRFFRSSPLTARLAGGASLLFADARSTATVRDGRGQGDKTGHLAIQEPTRRLLTPFIASELRWGRSVARWLTVDFGVTLMMFVPPAVDRAGRRMPTEGEASRDLGIVTLPDAPYSRPFLALVPSVGGSFEPW